MPDIKKLVAEMTLDEKISMLAGKDLWHTEWGARCYTGQWPGFGVRAGGDRLGRDLECGVDRTRRQAPGRGD